MPKYTFEERIELRKKQIVKDIALQQHQRLLDQEKLLGLVSYRDADEETSTETAAAEQDTQFKLKGKSSRKGGVTLNIQDIEKQPQQQS